MILNYLALGGQYSLINHYTELNFVAFHLRSLVQ